MNIEDLAQEAAGKDSQPAPVRSRAGFGAGVLLGAVLGAALVLFLAPDRGHKTRRRLRRRIQSWQEDARDGIDRAGSRTREELRRRKRRFQTELARARERAQRDRD